MAQDFKNNSDYLVLSELAKAQTYSLEYLLLAASSGQLKAFKMGHEWLTTADWFDEYNSRVKDNLGLEIINSNNHQTGWVTLIHNTGSRLVLIPSMLLILIIFSLFSVSLSWLVYHPQGHQAALAVSNLTSQRHVLGQKFINYTDQVYSTSAEAVLFVFGRSHNTLRVVYNSTIDFGQEVTYLATAVDNKLEPYKFSDEVITDLAHQLIATARHKYQSVAGASHIRKQIYFEEWQESIGFQGLE